MITDSMYQIGRKGKSSFTYGSAGSKKILAAVKRCRNVGTVDNPDQEIQFTEKLLDSLPQWVAEQLLDIINAENNLAPEDVED